MTDSEYLMQINAGSINRSVWIAIVLVRWLETRWSTSSLQPSPPVKRKKTPQNEKKYILKEEEQEEPEEQGEKWQQRGGHVSTFPLALQLGTHRRAVWKCLHLSRPAHAGHRAGDHTGAHVGAHARHRTVGLGRTLAPGEAGGRERERERERKERLPASLDSTSTWRLGSIR